MRNLKHWENKSLLEKELFFCKPNHTVSRIFCLFNFPTGSEVNSNKLSQFQTANFFWFFFTIIYKIGPQYFSSPSAPKLKSNQYPVVWKYQCFFTRLCFLQNFILSLFHSFSNPFFQISLHFPITVVLCLLRLLLSNEVLYSLCISIFFSVVCGFFACPWNKK